MSLESRTYLRPEDLGPLAGDWNALAASRGIQADFYDTHVWLESWLSAAGEDEGARLRVPAVLEDGRPIALLPLTASRGGHWRSVGLGYRMRYRPVVRGEEPEGEALGLLAEAAARAGARQLTLTALPERDPVSSSLTEALRRAGYETSVRPGSSEALAQVEAGWAEHRKRFRKYDQTVKWRVNKARRLGEVALESYGPGGPSPLEAFDTYLGLHARSWKQRLGDRMAHHRRELLRRGEAIDLGRLFVLRVCGVPSAAQIWFRLGDVAFYYSTVYDERLTALGPGTILLWWVHQWIFEERPPRLVDSLPGHNPQKDQLSPDRTRLLLLEAARKTMISSVSFPLRRQLRRATRAAARRLSRGAEKGRDGAPAPTHGRRVRVEPGQAVPAAAPLEIDPATEMYLSVCGGHRSPKKMKETWTEGDTWWRVGTGPSALLRVSAEGEGARIVREIVLVEDEEADAEDILRSVAASLGTALEADLPADRGGEALSPIPVQTAPLPWPGADGSGASH